MRKYRGVPQKFKEDGVFVHYREKVKVGNRVEALHYVKGEVPKGTVACVTAIIIEPNGNIRGFTKRIKLKGFDGLYNPKKFQKV